MGLTGNKEKVMVTAVAGKKIVPMWVCVTNSVMGTVNLKYDMKSGSSTLVNGALQSALTWPIFHRFDGEFITAIGENENLSIKVYGANTNKFYVTVGYYLI
ncbi:MAG: hypothetical protein ABIK92_21790 [Pseudomonadota bacterium]